ncbi:MAG: hypothetical protein ABI613_02330 [Gemmatimonadota bacterium]
MRQRLLFRIVALLVVTGCGGWQAIPGAPPSGFPDDAIVQVWTDHGVELLHSIHLEPDSIRGVHENRPYSCTPCRVAIPRDEIDSIRITRADDGKAGSFAGGFFVGFVGFWAYIFSH